MQATPPAQLVTTGEQLPYLIRAIRALGHDRAEDAEELAHDLSAITAMVAAKFTNDRTAEGVLEALRLTVGCISLGLAHARLQNDDRAAADLLAAQGAERVFQQGYRLIKELSALPDAAMIAAYDRSPQEQERRLKHTFFQLCDADPNEFWLAHKQYQREWDSRSKVLDTINCAKWLRKHHADGPVRNADMDAEGVIAIALIFAIQGGGVITAKAGQKELESLLATLRKHKPDIEQGWRALLARVPQEFQPVLRERLLHMRDSAIVRHILELGSLAKPGKARLARLFQELQNHGGNEIEVDYD